MRRIIITSFLIALLGVVWQQARGFSLLGPLSGFAGIPSTNSDAYQTPSIGYDLPGDNGTPKNVGQGYRWNTPVIYYTFDASFSGIDDAGFFGLQGEQAVNNAFAILNNAFTNNSVGTLDGYSSNLVEFPFNSQSYNFTAESVGLTDLKSEVLVLMMEELGLAQPERFAWTLHDRFLPSGGKCPIDELYLVVQRNYYYTPTPLFQNLYSPYVNDTLYTYAIEELCNPPVPPDAVTVPIAVDPLAGTFTAVAGLGIGLGVVDVTGAWAHPEVGGYYNGLTRDDVGGLRYLMTSNNIVYEDPATTSQMEVTNNTLQPLYTQPLGPLLLFAATNPPTALLAAFPNLVIDSVSTNYTLVTNPVVVAYFTNIIGQSAGSPPIFVVATNNYTYSFQTNYVYTFANMVIFNYSSNTPAQLQTISLIAPIGYPAGTIFTNVTDQNILLPTPSGQYFLVPTNSCGFDLAVTDKLDVFDGTFTNSTVATATNTGTVDTGFVGSESIVENLTNSLLQYFECDFETSTPAYYQGIGRMQFVRIPDTQFDFTTGLLRTPITNTYSMVWFNPTNSQLGTRVFQRVVTQPDILFSAYDWTAPVGAAQIGAAFGGRSAPNWDVAHIVPDLAGPGTINTPISISLNNVGTVFGNGSLAENGFGTNGSLSQLTQAGLLAYGSFDGTTNAPVVYPNSTSIQELESELVITVTPPTLPNGTNGVTYPVTTFSASGGQPPYSWSYSTNLPEGLSFYNGVLSGTPVNNPVGTGQNYGTYDFNIILTDSGNRVVSLPYTINIYTNQAP